MTTRAIRNEIDRSAVIRLIEQRDMPFTVSIVKGAPRSIEQNKLQRMWLREAHEQLQDHAIEELRGYCKLHFGVPIMRNESDEFRDVYDRIIRPLSYEQKLELMVVPIDLPVTRIMNTKQKKQYLDDMSQHFRELGVELTEPHMEG